jgi:hypothetical protein
MNAKMQDSVVTTTEKLVHDYMVPTAPTSVTWEAGESSNGSSRLSAFQGGGFRSVRARFSS